MNLTKTSSFSYSPVKDKTFDSLSKSPKKVKCFIIKGINFNEINNN